MTIRFNGTTSTAGNNMSGTHHDSATVVGIHQKQHDHVVEVGSWPPKSGRDVDPS